MLNEFDQPIGQPVPNWQGCPQPSTNLLPGQYCRLSRLTPSTLNRHQAALDDLFVQQTAPQQWTYLGYGPFDTMQSFRDWMERACLGNDPLFYIVESSDGTDALGLMSYLRIDPAQGVLEIGHIHFGEAIQRTAAATEANFLLLRHAFDTLGYRRVEWKCDHLNERSRAAALRLGFQFEGTFRQARVYKGRNRDTAWYAITDQDWPSIGLSIERWLAAENFDDSGKQRRRLQDFLSQHG